MTQYGSRHSLADQGYFGVAGEPRSLLVRHGSGRARAARQ